MAIARRKAKKKVTKKKVTKKRVVRRRASSSGSSSMDSDQRDLYEKLMLAAVNDGSAFRSKNASRAVDNAFREYRRFLLSDLQYDFDSIRREMVKDIQAYWKRSKDEAALLDM